MTFCYLSLWLVACLFSLIGVIYTYRRDVQWRQTLAMLTELEAMPVVCAWCPEFDSFDPINRRATHSICEPCAARLAESDGE